jgi:predicted secreted protein with PEFG-CTERM motif
VNYSHIVLLFVTSMLLVFTQQAFAQSPDCRICVAEKFYEQGETVVILGRVDAVLPNTDLLIQVYSNNNRVHIAQVTVAQDGSFTYSFPADGPYFKSDGKYTVQASYGPSGNIYETSFEFQTKGSASAITQIFEVRAGDSGTFDVPYTIRGGTVKNMFIDPAMLALVIQIQSDNDGTLILDLGRKWIDAKKPDGTDDTYIIQIDGVQIPYQESSASPNSRIITIQFLEGDSDIEIIGTYVIPEFGTIATLVLVVSIVSAIFLSAKKGISRLS